MISLMIGIELMIGFESLNCLETRSFDEEKLEDFRRFPRIKFAKFMDYKKEIGFFGSFTSGINFLWHR